VSFFLSILPRTVERAPYKGWRRLPGSSFNLHGSHLRLVQRWMQDPELGCIRLQMLE
jgi:hypothetical protein